MKVSSGDESHCTGVFLEKNTDRAKCFRIISLLIMFIIVVFKMEINFYTSSVIEIDGSTVFVW